MAENKFRYRMTCGWLRDLASEPTPFEPWPSIRWDAQLTADQERFLDAQGEMDVEINSVWGLFADRAWPTDLAKAGASPRGEQVQRFTSAAHQRKVKIVTGMGIYSWGFDAIIKEHPEVTNSDSNHSVMCPYQPAAWDWQRRVLDFVMDPKWGIDGISMQSADQGRCQCPKCKPRSNAEHHADILMRSSAYVRQQRPDWIVGTACWGLRVDEEEEMAHVLRMSGAFDYLVEVDEQSARKGIRPKLVKDMKCAFGSVGGTFVEPPQHWERLRWFVPVGLGNATAISQLFADGGMACEMYYRPFANPVEEVSWRAAAQALNAPQGKPVDAVRQAVARVYGTSGSQNDQLTDWMIRGENAYLSRSTYKVGQGPLSLEPLIWDKNPSVPGPPLYLRDRMTAEQRRDYAAELRGLKRELAAMAIPNEAAAKRTLTAIDGALAELAALA
ncbi:MAG: hypothetical protein IT443_09035 [Phycisphaeraceae bacterium]|nr:hypothetical protein [Phycisphaeraceae bacterium]